MEINGYLLSFYVPDEHAEQVKQAVFAAGAGKFQQYDQCCWQTQGTGQFRPLAGSQPFIGQQQQLNRISEWKIEMICVAENLRSVIAALQDAHPYEEPAYQVIPFTR